MMNEGLYSVRAYMGKSLYDRLCRWAFRHDLTLSAACRLILEYASLDLPAAVSPAPEGLFLLPEDEEKLNALADPLPFSLMI